MKTWKKRIDNMAVRGEQVVFWGPNMNTNIIQIHIFASILELREILCLFVVNLSNYLNILFLLNRSFSKGSIDGTFVRKLKRKQVEKLNFLF